MLGLVAALKAGDLAVREEDLVLALSLLQVPTLSPSLEDCVGTKTSRHAPRDV